MSISDFIKGLLVLGNKPLGPAVLNANGDLVGNIIPRTGNLADLQALAGTAGEQASALDFPAQVQFTGVAGQAKTTFPTATGLRAAVVPTIPGFIGTNTTMTIGSGKNFADMAAWKIFIEQCVVDESATITLLFDAGTHTGIAPSAGKTWPHVALCSDGTLGAEVITDVSISTVTGSAGAWVITLAKTGLAASIGLAATDANRAMSIIDGTAGTNPDNAVGVYTGITYVDANTIRVNSASALTAMPTATPVCTIYAPKATLSSIDSGGTNGGYRSITFGSSALNYQPVAVGTINGLVKEQTIRTSGVAKIVSAEFTPAGCVVNIGGSYSYNFNPSYCTFLAPVIVIADGFYLDRTNASIQSGSFLIDQGFGTTSYGGEASMARFSGVTVINTLADGQLEPKNVSFWQVFSMTINGTQVTGANLANYTTLTPGTLSATGGFIYFG